ncbi:septal ring lytic transglycosylase RlpA family protein [Psychromonas sp. RZ22]|uniref:septal ring lytic transglycosylase RlpA family protein n=1 Tax=Psychromonas algarum TaxID=2555643 RepID=UPI001067D46E|nr:septal ring lytic transglycosylase RlpA family protein [Psychromonas sp. RZ22]TEW54936.1 septal ring lytic transglycosylase RlpA family protein [Psychromonas sp. RZ22]
MKKLLITCFISLLLTACSHNNERYQISNDHAPTEIPNLEHIENVTPRYEPLSRGGNRDYTVRGIDYKVWRDITELTERGGASWYGNKFHGHLTSNGERYNMFAMSAAHKNLPLPSYVQVTNLANKKQIIVRVNDRGPFHEGRIIDLSYAAAKKLDILQAGTGQVEIKLLHFPEEKHLSLLDKKQTESINGVFHIQYLVTSSADKAALLSKTLTQKHKAPAFFEKKNNLYFLRIGPLTSEAKTEKLLRAIQKDYPKAYIIHQQP